ncbi:MAG: peptidylprolyl isomerase, partial [Planctomycetota bacterium]
RIYVDKLLKMETTEGEAVFRLRPDEAPNTVWHIRELARGGFYTDIPFHRVLPTHPSGKPFVIQAGDPLGEGGGGPGVFIDLEPSELMHAFGVLSMARTNDPDTNGSQFFVALSSEATVHLNGAYTAFGEAVSGAETIIAIEQTPLADTRLGRPANPPRIVNAELIDAPPFGTGPEPVQRPAPSRER